MKKKIRKMTWLISAVALVAGSMIMTGCTPKTPTPAPETDAVVEAGYLIEFSYHPGYSDMDGGYHSEKLQKNENGDWVITAYDRNNFEEPEIVTIYAVSEENVKEFETFVKEKNVLALKDRSESDLFVTDYRPWGYSFIFNNASVGGEKRVDYSFSQYQNYSDRDMELMKALDDKFDAMHGEILSQGPVEEYTEPEEESSEPKEESSEPEELSSEESVENESSDDPSESESSAPESETGSENTPSKRFVYNDEDYKKAVQMLAKLEYKTCTTKEVAELLGDPDHRFERKEKNLADYTFTTLIWQVTDEYRIYAYFLSDGENERLTNAWITYDNGSFNWTGIPEPWTLSDFLFGGDAADSQKQQKPDAQTENDEQTKPDAEQEKDPAASDTDIDPKEAFARLKAEAEQGKITELLCDEVTDILGQNYQYYREYEELYLWNYEEYQIIGLTALRVKDTENENSFACQDRFAFTLVEKRDRDVLKEILEPMQDITDLTNSGQMRKTFGEPAFTYSSDFEVWFIGDYQIFYAPITITSREQVHITIAAPQTAPDVNLHITIPDLIKDSDYGTEIPL